MTKVFSSLKKFIAEDYSTRYYGFIALFLALSIFLNYHYEIEDVVIDRQSSKLFQFLLYLLLYSTAYYGVLGILFFIKKKNYFANKEVLIKSFTAILILSIDGTFRFTTDFLKNEYAFSSFEAYYLQKVLNQSTPVFGYILILALLHKKYDATLPHLYGLSGKGFDWKPYLILLSGMLPLIVWASFQQDFTNEYPVLKYWKLSSVFGLSIFQMFSIYEFFYLIDFINIELLFRGLLIIGMIKIMDKDVLLPMVSMYAFLHFGKPPAETLSSIFGGYILGVLAYRTNTILGGFLIHIGIALLMDVFAILQIQFFH